MSNSLADSPMDSGYPNAVMLVVWNLLYRKQIFAGFVSMHTGCPSEHRARADPFTLPVIRQRGHRLLPATLPSANKSGVRAQVIPAIQLTGIFIATSVSICPWNIWDRWRAEPENSPV